MAEISKFCILCMHFFTFLLPPKNFLCPPPPRILTLVSPLCNTTIISISDIYKQTGMPVFRFLPYSVFFVCPNLCVVIHFQPIFGCFGSNLRAFSDFSHQFQVFWVGLTGIPEQRVLTVDFCLRIFFFIVHFSYLFHQSQNFYQPPKKGNFKLIVSIRVDNFPKRNASDKMQKWHFT